VDALSAFSGCLTAEFCDQFRVLKGKALLLGLVLGATKGQSA